MRSTGGRQEFRIVCCTAWMEYGNERRLYLVSALSASLNVFVDKHIRLLSFILALFTVRIPLPSATNAILTPVLTFLVHATNIAY